VRKIPQSKGNTKQMNMTIPHEPYHDWFQKRKDAREARATREAAVELFLAPASPPPPAPLAARMTRPRAKPEEAAQ
jgi:hypothetical protein